MALRPLRPLLGVAALAAAAALPAGAGPSRPPASSLPGAVQPDPGTAIDASRNSRVAAFAASWRRNGTRYDPAADPTVFLWDRRLGSLVQVTAAGPCDQPSVENGTYRLEVGTKTDKETRVRTVAVFRSTADLTGGNGDGSAEIFAWDSLNGGITQITNALAGASSRPAVGAVFAPEKDSLGRNTGKILVRHRTAFLSTADLAGDNPAGLPQVFLHDSGADEVDRIRQISHSATGAAGPPSVDRGGTRIVFVHDGDLLPGAAPPGTAAVYVYDLPTGTLLRLTPDEETGAGAEDPVIDVRGRFVAWSATGPGPGPRSVHLADLQRGTVQSFVPEAGEHRAPALGRGGGRLVILSTEPLPGEGGAPVPERPLLLRRRRGPAAIGVEGPGGFGRPVLLRNRRRMFLTSTADLDGANASGRDVLYLVRVRRR